MDIIQLLRLVPTDTTFQVSLRAQGQGSPSSTSSRDFTPRQQQFQWLKVRPHGKLQKLTRIVYARNQKIAIMILSCRIKYPKKADYMNELWITFITGLLIFLIFKVVWYEPSEAPTVLALGGILSVWETPDGLYGLAYSVTKWVKF